MKFQQNQYPLNLHVDSICLRYLQSYFSTVSFVPRSPAVSDKPKPESSIRNIGAAQIGSLVTLRAMVTRVTDVKPLATVACYTCDTCGYELYQPIEAKSFTPLIKCTSAVCGNSSKPGTVFLQTRGTKFDKFQEIRVQELVYI